jgi:hypothetical protein
VELIAIAREDQPIARVVFPGKDKQAHVLIVEHGSDCEMRSTD